MEVGYNLGNEMEDISIQPGLSIRDDSIQERLLEFTLSKRHFAILRAITKGNLHRVYDVMLYVKRELHVPYETKLLAEDLQDLKELGVVQFIATEPSKVSGKRKRRK